MKRVTATMTRILQKVDLNSREKEIINDIINQRQEEFNQMLNDRRRIKVPDCFGSRPSPQEVAENDCHTCGVRSQCHISGIKGRDAIIAEHKKGERKMSEKIKQIGILGRALKNQASFYGFDVTRGDLSVIQEGYDKNLWEPVRIDRKGKVFIVDLVDEEPLTFEKIKRECVVGESLLIDENGKDRLFLGFTRIGRIVVEDSKGIDAIAYAECTMRNWKISKEKWSGE